MIKLTYFLEAIASSSCKLKTQIVVFFFSSSTVGEFQKFHKHNNGSPSKLTLGIERLMTGNSGTLVLSKLLLVCQWAPRFFDSRTEPKPENQYQNNVWMCHSCPEQNRPPLSIRCPPHVWLLKCVRRLTHSSFRYIAVAWEGELPCRKWDCECAFKRQRGCCCGAPELRVLEDQILSRMMGLWTELSRLSEGVLEVIGTFKQRHT